MHVIYVVVILLAAFIIYRIRTKFLRKSIKVLRQRDMLAKDIQRQKEILGHRNKEMVDSLFYAQRIQKAMLISDRQFKEIMPDSFIVLRSKDIVNGDFYWISRIQDKIFIAAVDCTGHGVPGAFISVIGLELLRKIINTQNIYEPDRILEALSSNLYEIFGNEEGTSLRDGMDIALCVLYKDQNYLDFSGAYCPLYIIRDSNLIEVKGDSFSVGPEFSNGKAILNNYKNNKVLLEPDDMIYIFSDGYADQFGGPEGKKFKYRRFRHLLLTIHKLPLENQKVYLEKSLDEWQGNLEQLDDILVIGFKHHPLKS